MKIREKILACLLMSFVLLLMVSSAAYWASSKVDYYRRESVALAKQIVALTNLRAQVRNQLLENYEVGFVEGHKGHEEDLKNEKKLVLSMFTELEALIVDHKKSQEIQVLKREYDLVDQGLDEVSRLVRNGKFKIAKLAILEVRQSKFNDGFIKEISLQVDAQKLIAKVSSQKLHRSIEQLQEILLFCAVFALVLTVILMIYISKAIGNRLFQLESATRKIADGDFNVSLSEQGSDEVSLLSKAFNLMAASLAEAKGKLSQQQDLLTYSAKMSALGEMAGGVAHEINTPLAVIQMRTEQLLECITDNTLDNELLTDALEGIDKTVRRIAKIVSGLKSFARDGQKDPMIQYSLSKIVEETFLLCRERFHIQQVQFELVAPQDIEIFCRPSEIGQVILNLLNNSFDAVEHLQNKWVKIELSHTDKVAKLSITDSGTGIPNEIQSKIMQPFFTTKEVGKGTGLGLSISKGIIESHSGKIAIDNTKSNTTIVVELPSVTAAKNREIGAA